MPFCVAFDHTPAQPSGPRLPMLSGDFLWGKGAQGPEVRSINRERDASRVQRAPGNQSKGRRIREASSPWGAGKRVQGASSPRGVREEPSREHNLQNGQIRDARSENGAMNYGKPKRSRASTAAVGGKKGGRAAGRDCGKLIRTPKVIKAERK